MEHSIFHFVLKTLFYGFYFEIFEIFLFPFLYTFLIEIRLIHKIDCFLLNKSNATNIIGEKGIKGQKGLFTKKYHFPFRKYIDGITKQEISAEIA